MSDKGLAHSPEAALIERLEKADAGSRELDALICDVLVPVRPVRRVVGNGDYDGNAYDRKQICEAAPTTSIDAALALAERALPDHDVQITKGAKEDPLVAVAHYLSVETEEATARTIPLALCIAILKATTANAVGISALRGNEPSPILSPETNEQTPVTQTGGA